MPSTPLPPLHIHYQDEHMMVLIKPQGMATMGLIPKMKQQNCGNAKSGMSKNTVDDEPNVEGSMSTFSSSFHERHNQKLATSTPAEETVSNSDVLLLCTENEYQELHRQRKETPKKGPKPFRKAVPVHRLDRCTGGLLLCAKSMAAERLLRRLFQDNSCAFMDADKSTASSTINSAASSRVAGASESIVSAHLIRKRYRCVVSGVMSPELGGEISLAVDGKPSVTRFEVVLVSRSARYGGWISTLDCFPLTGRRHQIRKHLAAVGHPIIGDPRYTRAASWPDPMPVLVAPVSVFESTGAPSSYACEVLTQRHCSLSPPFFLWAVELKFPTLSCTPADAESVGEVTCDRTRFCTIGTEEPAFYGVFRDIQSAEYEAQEANPSIEIAPFDASASCVCQHPKMPTVSAEMQPEEIQ